MWMKKNVSTCQFQPCILLNLRYSYEASRCDVQPVSLKLPPYTLPISILPFSAVYKILLALDSIALYVTLLTSAPTARALVSLEISLPPMVVMTLRIL